MNGVSRRDGGMFSISRINLAKPYVARALLMRHRCGGGPGVRGTGEVARHRYGLPAEREREKRGGREKRQAADDGLQDATGILPVPVHKDPREILDPIVPP